jgi:lipopolysaccharide/colanic/teichoic acid biosynthesis glycosyltransferase/cellulose synthase/poly-beta-1,6-N-acetylglucosamine synthase-like glycosyltransferase
MTLETVLLTLLITSVALVVYHHVIFPLLLELLASRRRGRRPSPAPLPLEALPTVAVIVPAYNEAGYIAQKVRNLSELDYPADKVRFVITLDGCTDDTAQVIKAALASLPNAQLFEIADHSDNLGKIARLNDAIGQRKEQIVVLSDASALVFPDALRRTVAHFAAADMGVVCATYRLSNPGSEGERAYWQYQTRIKASEAALAAPLGAHGAFYAFRRDLWKPLPSDTINDDFFIPMRIVQAGYRAVYDQQIVATELEQTTAPMEFRRRARIGAGNMQQLVRLRGLMNPLRGWLAFTFASGKGLRPMVPALLVIGGLSTALLIAISEGGLLKLSLTIGALALAYGIGIRTGFKPVAWLRYFFEGHFASGVGAARYLVRDRSQPFSWRPFARDGATLPQSVAFLKRACDIVLSLLILVVLAILIIPLAIIIKLDSRGPVFYRQLRVGLGVRGAPRNFVLYKLRSMTADAEQKTGAIWAKKNDPRITRVGKFLRKTRLDELPQCINVLRGDMAIVGPRPERPEIVQQLETTIPFYIERTYGLKPGVTGLAQVSQGYDASINDVRSKVMYDHAYALRLGSAWSWLKTDLSILLRTITVMVRGQGT